MAGGLPIHDSAEWQSNGALRSPRPRSSGRPEWGELVGGRDSVPSPGAAPGDGDSAARRPYPGGRRVAVVFVEDRL